MSQDQRLIQGIEEQILSCDNAISLSEKETTRLRKRLLVLQERRMRLLHKKNE